MIRLTPVGGCAAFTFFVWTIASAQDKVQEKQPLTVDRILALRVPQDPQISPDGQIVAFTVRETSIPENKDHRALYLLSVDRGGTPLKLFEDDSLSEVHWQPDGKSLTYLSGRSGTTQVWQLRVDHGQPEQLTQHDVSISEYAWSADTKRLAFLTKDAPNGQRENEALAKGIVYDDTVFGFSNLMNNSWFFAAPQAWIFDISSGKEELIWQQSEPSFDLISGAAGLAWSPEGTRLAFMYNGASAERGSFWASRIGFVDVHTKKFTMLNRWNAASQSPEWSPDGKTLAFRSNHEEYESRYGGNQSGLIAVSESGDKTAVLALPTDNVRRHWWISDQALLVERSDFDVTSLYLLSTGSKTSHKIARTRDHLHDCSFAATPRRAACIRENSTTPPEIAIAEFRSGAVKTLTSLNEEYKTFALGEVSLIKWRNKDINDGQGYLVKPLNYVKGKRYPLLLLTYSFNGGFIWQAQWQPNYPVQVFAARGYAVLLANPPPYCPGYPGYRYGDAEGAGIADFFGTGARESLLNAMDMLVDTGIADPNRFGIMGLSGGGDLTDVMITHSDRFKAASSADGSSFNGPVGYVIGGMTMQRGVAQIGGQSPYVQGGSPLQTAMAASWNAFRTHTPVLMEYRDRNALGLEFYTAMKSQGKPVELVFYPHDAHVLEKPKARQASMTRNLDWFDFWIERKEDPDPQKIEQYARWHKLRELQKASATTKTDAH